MTLGKRAVAEFFGTLWLVFGGCGAAVLDAAFPGLGIGFLGVAFAFGLTVLTVAFAICHISGCHLNPAVSLGLAIGKRFPFGVASLLDCTSSGWSRRSRRPLSNRFRQRGLLSRRGLCLQRLRCSLTGWLFSASLSHRGNCPYPFLSTRHYGFHRSPCSPRFRAYRYRSLPHAYSSRWHSCYESIRESSP